MAKSIAVVIPTYKPDDKFLRLMNMLIRQSYPIQEILIINTEASFFEKLVPEKDFLTIYPCAKIRHIRQDEFDHGGTRNLGMQHVTADYVLCMTQDAVPYDQNLLENLMAGFQDPSVAISYGRQITEENSGKLEKYTRDFNYPPESLIKTKESFGTLGIKAIFSSNVCAMYDKKVFDQLGGFVNRTIFNEDMIFAYSVLMADYKIAYQAEAKVIHSHTYSLKQQFQRNFDLAVSQKDNSHIFMEISSEKEGIRFVKNILQYLWKNQQKTKIPYFIIESGFKYLGYQAGLRYNSLPKGLIMKWTMNQNYWK